MTNPDLVTFVWSAVTSGVIGNATYEVRQGEGVGHIRHVERERNAFSMFEEERDLLATIARNTTREADRPDFARPTLQRRSLPATSAEHKG